MFLLDTNTCIRFLNGRSEAIRLRLEQVPPELIALCSVVKAELFYGAAKSVDPSKTLTRAGMTVRQIAGLLRAAVESQGISRRAPY